MGVTSLVYRNTCSMQCAQFPILKWLFFRNQCGEWSWGSGLAACVVSILCTSVTYPSLVARVGLATTIYIYIYGVYTVFFAGISSNIRAYTVCIYGSGQP